MASTWRSTISTAQTSNSPRGLALAAILLVGTPATLAACPFCTALKPSLAQLREQAAVVALAEVVAPLADARARLTRVHLQRVFKGSERLADSQFTDVRLDVAAPSGALILLFGTAGEPAAKLSWHAVRVNETSYAYFARAPSLKTPLAERLRYFSPYLEHVDPLLAEDAYLEFGHAPFDEVARSADALPVNKLRTWLTDPRVPPARKGFYGLAVGLSSPADARPAAAEFLRGLVFAPDDDFRAGFDGILGGYLLLAGTPGLELVETRLLSNPRAADGDVRHALTALRFYHEYGREISAERIERAVALLVDRPEFAAAAITDLARWQAWTAVERVVAAYQPSGEDAATRRAVVGYLLACPQSKAATALANLRQADPSGVAAAEQVLSKTSSVPAAE